MATRKKKVEYIPVELASIRFDTVKAFDLHLKVKRDKYILYLAGDSPFTEESLEHLAVPTTGVERSGGLEEYLFAFTFGAFWAPLYEAWKDEKYSKSDENICQYVLEEEWNREKKSQE